MTNSELCTVWLPIECHDFTTRINSKGYLRVITLWFLVLSFIFLETVWVPLIISKTELRNIEFKRLMNN